MSGLANWGLLADDVVAAAFPELAESPERDLVVERISADLEDRVMTSFWSGLTDNHRQLLLRLSDEGDPRLPDALDALGFGRVTAEETELLLVEVRGAAVAQSLVDRPAPTRPRPSRRRGLAVVVDLERRSHERSRSADGTSRSEGGVT